MNGIFEFLWYSSLQFRKKYTGLVENWQENKGDEYQLPIQNFGQSVLEYWKMNPEVRSEYDELLADIGEGMDQFNPEHILEAMRIGLERTAGSSSEDSVNR